MNSGRAKKSKDTIVNALYLVPTPIGNMDDMTFRAIEVLKNVDIIACEDTRHSGILLKYFDISPKQLESYHEHNEEKKSEFLLKELISGKTVAIITDAGTPGISDPGYRIIKKAIENGVKVITLPGATAFVPALVSSGFSSGRFLFASFPPHKKGRKTFLENLSREKNPIILYESPFRIIKLIEEISMIFGAERRICLGREISKIFEEYIRGTASECLEKLKSSAAIKGEFVVVIEKFTE